MAINTSAPASTTGQVNLASTLPQSITTYIRGLLSGAPNFGPAGRAASASYAHPSLMTGPGNSWIDPQQANTVDQTNYLGERGNIAGNFLQNQQGLASDLLQSTSAFANLQNAIPFLNAAAIKQGSSSTGLGTLFGGF